MSIFDKIPNFGSFAQAIGKEHSPRPDIVDVESQEVKQSHESPESDRKARASQLVDEAFRISADLMQDAPFRTVVLMAMWLNGAKWADNHRMSTYPDWASWVSAGREALGKLLQEGNPEVLQNPVFCSILFLSFNLGAQWAENNPANDRQCN